MITLEELSELRQMSLSSRIPVAEIIEYMRVKEMKRKNDLEESAMKGRSFVVDVSELDRISPSTWAMEPYYYTKGSQADLHMNAVTRIDGAGC
jgi:hypothetical protein